MSYRAQSAPTQESRRGPASAADSAAGAPARLGLSASARLASTLGNRAFGRLLPAQVEVGVFDDTYEREADRLADQALRQPPDRAGRAEGEGNGRATASARGAA